VAVVDVEIYRCVYGVCRGRCLLVLPLWRVGFSTTMTTDLRRGEVMVWEQRVFGCRC
jgi:hypothetical protein